MPTIKISIRCVTMGNEAPKNCKSRSAPPACQQKHVHQSAHKLRKLKKIEDIASMDALRHMCEYCGYRTRIGANLRVHKRRHTGEKPFRCSICNACFVARYQLTTHKERHLDDQQRRNRHMCKVCNVGFLSARALYHHRPLHEAVKQYKCTLCDKSYAQAAGFAQHKRWHIQRNQRATVTTATFKLQ